LEDLGAWPLLPRTIGLLWQGLDEHAGPPPKALEPISVATQVAVIGSSLNKNAFPLRQKIDQLSIQLVLGWVRVTVGP
jgi:hypothetical protein